MGKIMLANGFKLGLMIAVISFAVFQFPVYYMYRGGIINPNEHYIMLLWRFSINWLSLNMLLIIPWLNIFIMLRVLYKPQWAKTVFKIIVLVIAEISMFMFLIVYFILFGGQNILPTYMVLATFIISYGIAVIFFNTEPLRLELYKERLSME